MNNYQLKMDTRRILTMDLGEAYALLQLIEAEEGLHQLALDSGSHLSNQHQLFLTFLAEVRKMVEQRIAELKPLFYQIVDETGRDYLSEN